jgi:hypothetical protein
MYNEIRQSIYFLTTMKILIMIIITTTSIETKITRNRTSLNKKN